MDCSQAVLHYFNQFIEKSSTFKYLFQMIASRSNYFCIVTECGVGMFLRASPSILN